MRKRPTPQDPDIKTCWVTWMKVGFGITQVLCFSKSVPMPIAVVWGLWSGGANTHQQKKFDVLHSYVLPLFRRHGVRTLINETLFSEGFGADVICTWDGTDDGKPFMTSSGYKFNSGSATWYLTRKMFEDNRKKRKTSA